MDFIQVNENDLQQQTKKRGTKRNRSSFLVMKNVCLVCIISLPIVEIHSFTTTPQVISFTRKNHVIECSLLSRKTRINNNKSNINDRSLNTVHENYNQLTSSSTLDYSSTGSRFLTKGTKNLLRNCKTSLLMSSVPSSSSSSNLSKDNNNVIIKKKSAIDIDDVESYHPLFSSNDISSDDENFDYAMHNNNKHNNHNKKQTNSWFNWFVKGSKPRGTNRVIMREAEELGGIARNDRYSSKDWYHNTITLPSSAILRNIRSPVLAVTCWATFLSLLHLKLLNTKYYLHVQYMYIPTTPHSLMMSALGLLLVFRTNSAYQRFAEGRVIWERIINASRDLSRLMILYNDEIGIDKRRRLQRLLVAFPYLLRHRIRPNLVMRRLDDENYERNPKHTILLYQDSGIKDNDVDAAMLAKVEEETGKSRRKKRPLYWVDKRTLPWRLVPPEALEKVSVFVLFSVN